jgi:hypothetical protein
MVSSWLRAAMVAALLAFAVGPVQAQQQEADDGGDYKPPSRLIARTPSEGAPRAGRPAALQNAARQQPAGAQTAQKTVGLISIVGDSFMVKTVGVTVVGNEEENIPIPAWKVDDRVTAKVTQLLSRNFRVKRIPVPAGTYAKYEKTLAGADYRERMRKLASDFGAAQKCDYYLLVAPGGSPVGDTNQGIGGIGTLRTTMLFNPVQHVFALTELFVFDPQFNRLRREDGNIGEDRFMVAIKGPNQELDEAQHLPEDPRTAVSDPRAKQIAMDLLDRSLAMTVPKLLAVD